MAAVFRKMYSSPAMSVTSRVIAALLGGYVLATAAGIAVAAWLPGEKHNGVIAGMLLTFTCWAGRCPPKAVLSEHYAGVDGCCSPSVSGYVCRFRE